jgi:hypothetical protein
VLSRTPKSLVGFNPVPLQLLEKSCGVSSFPTDVINQNGQHIFDLVAYLSGKRPPG